MHNFVETYQSAYGVKRADVNAVGTFYGGTTPLAWNDAMWAKYQIGAALGITDPATKAPLVRNWFHEPRKGDPVFLNGILSDANIASLVRRGAVFVMCRNAFTLWTMRLAKGGDPAPIQTEILANLVPGVVVVPAMVIAVQKAQEAGLTYMRT
jgi:intracellular sulfur oxidation DsrE/DsrF family protein